MAEDPYQILGVKPDASAADIRAAYRSLAKKHHPDLNPGNKAAEERFKQVSAAHEFLSDAEQRGRYDRGEIDASGAERRREPPPGYRHYAEQGAGERYTPGGSTSGFQGGAQNFEDLFANIFEARERGPSRGRDARYVLQAAFLDAINGATQRLTLPDGQVLDVKIPPGTADGDTLRLRGRGDPGRNGGPAGDALIEIRVAPHALFQRDGNDIRLELPVSLKEAVLGAKVAVPTPAGTVAMTLQPHAETGRELRLRGRGVPAHGNAPAGDLYVRLRVEIGPVDAALEEFLKSWAQPGFDPRAGLEGGAKK
ncbi:MAG: molecular chaperone DnaJ [Acidocella sp. 20-61-6]|nr:MAG: molecular chaperone DnaJ [Acidocella sp. 20-61-6]